MKVVINYVKPEHSADAGAKPSPSVIFGIDVAITNFLKAFFRYSRQQQFFFLPGSEESIEALKDIAQSEKVDFSRCAWISPSAPRETLCDVDVLFRPDPNLGDHIWRRLQMPGAGYALGSIVHTMSGERIAQVLCDHLLGPTRASDAILCPSHAIRDAVQSLWEIQGSYYAHRFKTPAVTSPVELPVIPLGIHTERFSTTTTPEHRVEQRAKLGIAEDEVVILYVGRLSYATKAHPLPLFRAAEMAAQQAAPKKIRLLMYGFYKPESMEADFKKLAGDTCRTVKVDFILNNDPRFPHGVWAAADIFSSLVDNIQESFGFTPIEAMASGLPAVISNWDGYRDGVRHGVDGFLVPTLGVPAGTNVDVARHYFNMHNYGDYLIRNNQTVAVDAEAAAAAFVVLIGDKAKRLAMGAHGRKRAQELYDWRTIINSIENVWEDQARRRPANVAGLTPQNWHAVHPAYPDPAAMFKSFPRHALHAQDRLELVGSVADVELLARHTMNIFGMDMLLDEDTLSAIMAYLNAHSGASIAQLEQALVGTDPSRFLRSIAWFLKMGLLRRLPPA